MIIISVEFIDQLIDYPINRASLNGCPRIHKAILLPYFSTVIAFLFFIHMQTKYLDGKQ